MHPDRVHEVHAASFAVRLVILLSPKSHNRKGKPMASRRPSTPPSAPPLKADPSPNPELPESPVGFGGEAARVAQTYAMALLIEGRTLNFIRAVGLSLTCLTTGESPSNKGREPR